MQCQGRRGKSVKSMCSAGSNFAERTINTRTLRRPMGLAIRRSLMTFNLTSHHISQLMKTKLSNPPECHNISPSVKDIIHGQHLMMSSIVIKLLYNTNGNVHRNPLNTNSTINTLEQTGKNQIVICHLYHCQILCTLGGLLM